SPFSNRTSFVPGCSGRTLNATIRARFSLPSLIHSASTLFPIRPPGELTMAAATSIGQAYLAEARRKLAACHEKIQHCVNQLNDAQVWWRPHPSLNSIANLILHLCGNVNQWIVAGVGGTRDTRNRPQEFAERGPMARQELRRRLDEVVRRADGALGQVLDADL